MLQQRDAAANPGVWLPVLLRGRGGNWDDRGELSGWSPEMDGLHKSLHGALWEGSSHAVEVQSAELCRLLALPRALQPPWPPMPAPRLLPVLGPRALAAGSEHWHRELGHLTSGD